MRYIPLIFLLTGCAWAEALGLYNPATDEPTTAGQAVSDVVRGLTGIDVAAIWALWKTLTTVGTQRGRRNAAAMVKPPPGTTRRGAFKALALGEHTPKPTSP